MWDDKSPQDHKPKEERLMVDIIAGRKAAGKFFYQYGFGEKMSSVPQKRLAEIICGLAMKGNQSRTTDFAELKQGFRTTYAIFCPKANGTSRQYPETNKRNRSRKQQNWPERNKFLST